MRHCAGLGRCRAELGEEDDAIKAVHPGKSLSTCLRRTLWSDACAVQHAVCTDNAQVSGRQICTGCASEGSLPQRQRPMARQNSAIAQARKSSRKQLTRLLRSCISAQSQQPRAAQRTSARLCEQACGSFPACGCALPCVLSCMICELASSWHAPSAHFSLTACLPLASGDTVGRACCTGWTASTRGPLCSTRRTLGGGQSAQGAAYGEDAANLRPGSAAPPLPQRSADGVRHRGS